MNLRDQLSSGGAVLADALQAYGWCRVCFSSWDETLARVARLLRYDFWPAELSGLLHAIYPAYFVYSAAAKLTGPGGPSRVADRRRLLLVMWIACTVLGSAGARKGNRLRRAARQATHGA